MGILVVLAPLLLGFGLIVASVLHRQHTKKNGTYSSYHLQPVEYLLAWGGGILATLGLITTLWAGQSNLDSANTVSDLEAFYHDTLSAYQYTIDRTEDVIIVARDGLDGTLTDFTYEEQGKAVSERIAELRDSITWYNEELRYLTRANTWPILGDFYYDVPEDLKPIKLEV